MRRIKINVLGSDYYIKTDADEEYVREIADYLDDKIKDLISENLGAALNVPRPLLLAILKITDDYFRVKKEFESYKKRVEERSGRLAEIIDASLSRRDIFPPERG